MLNNFSKFPPRRIKTLSKLRFPITYREFRSYYLGPKVIANSFPKGGTNLLLKVLSQIELFSPRWRIHFNNDTPGLLDKISRIGRGQYASGHLYWNKNLTKTFTENGIRSLFIVRDLRDIAVSNVFYITYKNPHHRLHRYFKSLENNDERLLASIQGIKGELLDDGIHSLSLYEHAKSYLPWTDDPDCLNIRFEDLIGEKGGGDDLTQKKVIREIIQHLSLENFVEEEELTLIASNTFSSRSKTFRKGLIGDWRNHFKDIHFSAFKEAEKINQKLGYF